MAQKIREMKEDTKNLLRVQDDNGNNNAMHCRFG